MVSDIPRIRYIFPKFKEGNYNKFMKTLESSCNFDASDIAKYRLKVVEFGIKYGWQAANDAFGVKRSTYFLWKKKVNFQGKLTSLVPRSTRPKRVRQMQVDPRIVLFIKNVREQYGRIGKEKLKILLSEYCKEIGIPAIKATAIGKIIKRNRFFFEGRKKYKRKRTNVLRVKKAPKEKIPGYIEFDSVIVRILNTTHVFITVIDVVTKQADCIYSSTPTSSRAKQLLVSFQQKYPYPIRAIQTDNGSEFLGFFEEYCQEQSIPHVFTYPRSPKINGVVERFNRTIQEEFIERSDSLYLGKESINTHLQKYLNWYNQTRPHQSLGYKSPSQYIQLLESNM